MGWTARMWRCLCLLALTSVLTVPTGVWLLLPPVWQGLVVVPGLLVALVLGVASYAGSRTSRSVSTKH